MKILWSLEFKINPQNPPNCRKPRLKPLPTPNLLLLTATDDFRIISALKKWTCKRIKYSFSCSRIVYNDFCIFSVWFGVIFVRSGIYESGIFRFSLFIPHTFPECNVGPNLVFESPVFHPLVHPETNELFLGNDSSLTNWRKNVSHLWQAIDYLKNIFYDIDTSSPVNERAASLWVCCTLNI